MTTKTNISKKLTVSIENWLDKGFTVTLDNHEPNHLGIVWTEINIELNTEEYPDPNEYSSYWYSNMSGEIAHRESTSPKAWELTQSLIGGL